MSFSFTASIDFAGWYIFGIVFVIIVMIISCGCFVCVCRTRNRGTNRCTILECLGEFCQVVCRFFRDCCSMTCEKIQEIPSVLQRSNSTSERRNSHSMERQRSLDHSGIPSANELPTYDSFNNENSGTIVVHV